MPCFISKPWKPKAECLRSAVESQLAMRFAIVSCLPFLFAACVQPKNLHAVIHTSAGDIRVRLFDSTPRHRDNFARAAQNTPSDTLLCYRAARDFAIQFGPPPEMAGRDIVLEPEIQAPLLVGALAAARADSSRFSDGTDFFIVLGRPQTEASLDEAAKKASAQFTPEERKRYKKHGGLPQLHGQYTVFGEVTDGLDVAQKIAALPRDASGRPLQVIKAWLEVPE